MAMCSIAIRNNIDKWVLLSMIRGINFHKKDTENDLLVIRLFFERGVIGYKRGPFQYNNSCCTISILFGFNDGK